MNHSITKFLEFKGENLLFLAKDGIYWVAIKPVCEVLKIEYTRTFKNIKKDGILGPALAIQPMQVPGDQLRNYACLPEFLIYGWVFSIKSDSKELLEYKRECYKILYEYFHGTITKRSNLIRKKVEVGHKRGKLEFDLKADSRFKEWETLKAEEARIGKSLKAVERTEFEEQSDLFNQAN